MTSKALLEKIGENVLSKTANHLDKQEKDAIEFLWKNYCRFQGE